MHERVESESRKITFFVTDNGSNMIRGINELNATLKMKQQQTEHQDEIENEAKIGSDTSCSEDDDIPLQQLLSRHLSLRRHAPTRSNDQADKHELDSADSESESG